MKVLVACEYSGTVRDAFLAKGHNAISCDILPTESDGPHYQGDVLDILKDGWDLMIAHPPCTYLSVSGMHWTTRGLRDPQLTEDALEFVKTLMFSNIPKVCIENPVSIINSRIRKPDQIIHPWMFGDNASKQTCLWLKNLNPLQINLYNITPPEDYKTVIGADYCTTCKCCDEPWCLHHTQHYYSCDCLGPMEEDIYYHNYNNKIMFGSKLQRHKKFRWGNQTSSGQNKLSPSTDRWKLRAKTYQGIAKAMAEQWG